MVAETELYDYLEVEPDCTDSELKKAYRRLALVHHPDRGGDRARFQEIQHAWETLSDPDKRADYDRYGSAKPGMAGGHYDDEGMDDIFQSMFGGMGGGMGGGRRRKEPVRPSVVKLDVTLEELFGEAEKKITVERDRKCHHCKGSGGKKGAKRRNCGKCRGEGFIVEMMQMGGFVSGRHVECPLCRGVGSVLRAQDQCKKCSGKRTMAEKKRLTMPLTRGIETGSKVIFSGEGDERADSPPADLYVTINALSHPTFTVSSNGDLSTSLSVTLSESLLGFSRQILTHLDGRAIMASHPPGKALQSGDELLARGEGMWKEGGRGRGNLRLRIEVEMPTRQWYQDLGPEKVALLEQLLPPKRAEVPVPPGTVSDHVNLENGAKRSNHKRRKQEEEAEETEWNESSRPGCTQQ